MDGPELEDLRQRARAFDAIVSFAAGGETVIVTRDALPACVLVPKETIAAMQLLQEKAGAVLHLLPEGSRGRGDYELALKRLNLVSFAMVAINVGGRPIQPADRL